MTEKWTASEYLEYLKTKQAPTKGNKFGAIRAEWNGRKFDSTGEMEYAQHLDTLKKSGEVNRVQYQYKLALEANGVFVCNYYIDFRLVISDGSIVLAEFKGHETDLWKNKWALLKSQLNEIEPGATLWLVKKTKKGFEKVEVFP